MLTRRGTGMLIGAAVLLVGGRLLGLVELFVLGAGVASLVTIGAVAVYARRANLSGDRHVEPARVHVGGESRVDLAVRNSGRARSPVVTIRDSFDSGARLARFLLAPLGPGETERASYRLPAERRGRFVLGPLEAHRSDPFGLVSSSSEIGPPIEITVYPAIEPVVEMATSRGHHTTSRQPVVTGPTGEDFATLRAYEVGDDLRRVHWPSTARLDELMIRQLDHSLEGHATVLLDLRARAHTPASLERALSAAASVIVACSRSGSLVRLTTTEGLDSGFGTGAAHVDAIMDRLAVAELGEGDHLPGAVGAITRSRQIGPAAFITTDALTGGELAVVANLQSRRREVAIVMFERDGAHPNRPPSAGEGGFQRAGQSTTLIGVPTGERFGPVWNRAMARGAARGHISARGWG